MDQATPIVSDENVLRFGVWLIGSLLTIIGILGGFLIKKIFSEVKAARLERSEFTNALNHKFRALNAYVKAHDRTGLLHSEKINNLVDQHQEYKKKTDQHAIQLSKHDADIDTLKKRL